MNQDKREPDPSTNVPHGQNADEPGRDVERETGGRQGESVERGPTEPRRDEGAVEAAKAKLEHAAEGAKAAAAEVGAVVKAAAEGIKESVVREETPTTLRTGESKKASTIDRLNDLVRGELASVETYELALKSVKDAELSGALEQIRESHQKRVNMLRERIRSLGGEPAKSSGVWGAFARAIQRGADLLGHRVALAALEEGEDQGKKRTTRDMDDMDDVTREFVVRELVPEQQRSHDLARSLQKFVKAA